ncbi:hypothetical protein ACVXHB_22475 [Escherichia coli]
MASAVDGQRRLIAVVMGADSAKGREEEARKLVRWGNKTLLRCKFCAVERSVGTHLVWR